MLPKDTFTHSSPKMVLTSYEFCANIACDIAIHAQQKSQVDYFNTTVLNSCSIAQPESCTQWSERNETSSKPVSQISSNGYYGFTHINKNVDMAAAENGNDVNIHSGKGESKTHKDLDNNSLNQLETFSFNITSIPQPKKRIRPNENCANKLEINAKRCRLETDKLPVIEPLSKMEVDIIEVDKDVNNLYDSANIHRMFTQPPCPPNNPKNNFEKSASYGLMPGQAQINARLSALRCNKSPETHRTLYRSESMCSRINKGAGTSKEIPCNDKNKRQLEQMFSETHGSGLFYLDLDEGSLK